MNYPGASCRGIEYKIQQTHKIQTATPKQSFEEFFRLKIVWITGIVFVKSKIQSEICIWGR